MFRLFPGGKGALPGTGELAADRGTSRLGRAEEVGVVMAWEEVDRLRAERGSLGVAIVDMMGVVGSP